MCREIVVVVYHHIGDETDALTRRLGVTTRSDTFERHVGYFRQNFDFISGSELITGILPRKSILITFDDPYRSVLDVAAPILKAVSAPSIFCLCPGILIGDDLPIDNILSIAVEELGWGRVLSILGIDNTGTPSVPQLLTGCVARMKQAQVRALKHRLCSAIGRTEAEIRRATNTFLGPADIKALSSLRMEIGNHSMTHPFFRSLSQDELETEITESCALLQGLSGQSVPYLSVPYGNRLDANEGVLEIARTSGHKAIFLVHAKSNRFPMGPNVYYRTPLGNAPT